MKCLSRQHGIYLAVVLALCSMVANAALPLDVTLRPRPQTYADSCQSYGMALAAASLPGTPLPASTAKELRVSENAIRNARDASVAAGETRMSHSVWKKAIEKASGGKLTTKIRYIQLAEDFYSEVEKTTGVSSAGSIGAILSATLLKTPVLTSVESVGKSAYASGHIVTILGLNKGASNPPGLALLNPAVKVGAAPEKSTCEFDDGPGDVKYQAFVSLEPVYKLKKFDAGYLFMTVVPK